MSAQLPRLARYELTIGSSLLVAVALLTMAVVRHRAPFAFDLRVLSVLRPDYHNRALDAVAELGSTPALVAGVALATVIAYRRDRRAALACSLAPLATIVVAQFVMKPLVGRHFGGGLCYPSGHVAAAIATAGALVLCTPPRWRPLAVVLGTAAVLGVSVAVILLGWHLPTDVLAALGLGLGLTLLAHGAAMGLPDATGDDRRDRVGATTSSAA